MLTSDLREMKNISLATILRNLDNNNNDDKHSFISHQNLSITNSLAMYSLQIT